MRLIDADLLTLHLNDYALQESPSDVESAGDRRISKEIYNVIRSCINSVDEQPTAYDVDKVVEQIESIKGKTQGACTDEQCEFCNYSRDCCDGERNDELALDKAIEIVKGGGVNA